MAEKHSIQHRDDGDDDDSSSSPIQDSECCKYTTSEGSSSPPKRRRTVSAFGLSSHGIDRHHLRRCLEPFLRRLVSEEVEKVVSRVAIPKIGYAYEENQSRNLRLNFTKRLQLPIFTGSKIGGVDGSILEIEIIDWQEGRRIDSGRESFQKVELVVLDGDFAQDDNLDCTAQEFDHCIVRERDGKRPLLTGEVGVSLRHGIGVVGELEFTDNSSWIRSRKFRLGARIAVGSQSRVRVMEAWTEAFIVKDHRGVLYQKKYPPELEDAVWRLEKVGKDGPLHTKLKQGGINTVCDFLRLFNRDRDQLRNILGNTFSNKMWDSTIKHALTCKLSGKLFLYSPPEYQNTALVFDVIHSLYGVIFGGKFIPRGEIGESNLPFVQKLVKDAHKHSYEMQEYRGGFPITDASSGSPWQHVQGYQRYSLHTQHTGTLPDENGEFATILDYATGNEHLESPFTWVGVERANVGTYDKQFAASSLVAPFSMPLHNSYLIDDKTIAWNQNSERIASDNCVIEPCDVTGGFLSTSENSVPISEMDSRGKYCEDSVRRKNLVCSSHSIEQPFNFLLNSQDPQGFMFSHLHSKSALQISGSGYIGWFKLKAALKWGMMYIRKIEAANSKITVPFVEYRKRNIDCIM